MIFFFVGITVALIWIFFKSEHRRSETYRGVVVKKYSVRKWTLKGRRVKNLYFLEVKTEDGRIIKVDIPFSLYSKIKVGDRVIKVKGENNPRILRPSIDKFQLHFKGSDEIKDKNRDSGEVRNASYLFASR